MQVVARTYTFEELFHSYKERIYHYVLAIVKKEEAAEEITQEIFIKLWLCREMLEQVENLDAYIYVIARNKSLNHLRKAANDVRLLNELKSFLPQLHNEVEERVSAGDAQSLINEAVNKLSPQRRQIYQLSRTEGLSHDEIAEKMNLSRQTVKNNLVEALKTIRKHLDKSGSAIVLLTVYMLS